MDVNDDAFILTSRDIVHDHRERTRSHRVRVVPDFL